MTKLRLLWWEKIQWSLQRTFSYLVWVLCECEWQWVKNFLIWLFRRCYRINLDECVKTSIQEYKSLNDFFTRSLKPGARTWAPQPGLLLSPVDGCISQMGEIHGETLLQAKGKTYTLSDLCAGDLTIVDLIRNGYFFTFYLAPSDYHRIHMPIAGTVRQTTYVPGFLFSVGVKNTKRVSQLFTRNERVISLFETELGPLVIIQVGSCLVGHMGTVWEGHGMPQQRSSTIMRKYYSHEQYCLAQMEEMGSFKLGSTVIVLIGPDKISREEGLYVGKRMRCSDSIARTLPRGIEPLPTP
jgi:phosphatidylserine decarboxylase